MALIHHDDGRDTTSYETQIRRRPVVLQQRARLGLVMLASSTQPQFYQAELLLDGSSLLHKSGLGTEIGFNTIASG